MHTFSSDLGVKRSNCGEAKSAMEITDRPIPMVKGMLLSLVLHAFFVTIILFSVNLSTQYPEIVRVLLTLEPSGGGVGEIRQATADAKKAQSLPVKGKLCRRSPTRQLHLSDRSPATYKSPVEPAADGVPLLDKTPVENRAPLTAINSGAREEAVASAGADAGIGAGRSGGSHEGAGKGREALESLRNRYLREHFAYIRDLILKNLSYPPLAKKGGWQGTVKVSFIIREDGKVEGVRIVESSGYIVLDRNVVETIREVQPFPKPPVRAELVIPVVYRLKT